MLHNSVEYLVLTCTSLTPVQFPETWTIACFSHRTCCWPLCWPLLSPSHRPTRSRESRMTEKKCFLCLLFFLGGGTTQCSVLCAFQPRYQDAELLKSYEIRDHLGHPSGGWGISWTVLSDAWGTKWFELELAVHKASILNPLSSSLPSPWFCFCFGATLLSLKSEIILGELWGPYRLSRIETRLVACGVNTYVLYYCFDYILPNLYKKAQILFWSRPHQFWRQS